MQRSHKGQQVPEMPASRHNMCEIKYKPNRLSCLNIQGVYSLVEDGLLNLLHIFWRHLFNKLCHCKSRALSLCSLFSCIVVNPPIKKIITVCFGGDPC